MMLTGRTIPLCRLIVLRSAVKLEALGLRHSSGRSMTALAKRDLGVRGSREKVLAALDVAIAAARAEIRQGDVT